MVCQYLTAGSGSFLADAIDRLPMPLFMCKGREVCQCFVDSRRVIMVSKLRKFWIAAGPEDSDCLTGITV